MATISRKKKKVKVTPEGAVHIKASFNNIMVTITDLQGNTVSWSSAGKNGFKGSKKNTPYASQITSEAAAKEAYDLGMRYVNVFIKGPGAGRDAAIRALQGAGLDVRTIKDITPLPHNGCRPPKRRRV
jgi:small subunit ribosomal protein S11